MFQVKLQHAFGIDLILGQGRLERDCAQRRFCPPVLELLRTLAVADAQVVERLLPAAGRKDRVAGVKAIQGRAADVAVLCPIERCAGAGKGGGEDGLEFVGIDADLFAGALQDVAEIVDFLRLPGSPRLRSVVHFGDGRRPQSFVVGLVNFMGEGFRLRNAFPFETIGQPMCDHLAGGAELLANEFGLPHQGLQDDIFLALLVDEIAATDLGRGLKLPVDAAVALFEARRVPREIDVDQVVAPHL